MSFFDQYQSANQQNPISKNFRSFDDLYGQIGRGTAAQGQLLQQGAEQLFRSRAEGVRAGFSEFQDRTMAGFQSQGVNPLFARNQVQQQRSIVPEQISAARGESQAQLSQGLAGLVGQDTESRVSLGQSQKFLEFQNYWNKKARKDRLRSQLLGGLTDIAGLGFMTKGFGLFGGGGGSSGGDKLAGLFANQAPGRLLSRY